MKNDVFQQEIQKNLQIQKECTKATELAWEFLLLPEIRKYTYNFSWLGRPLLQLPQDTMAMQDLIFRIQPDLIIEAGIAHGGSLILYASLLELNALCGGPKNAQVLGLDIDIREHNRKAIEEHPIYKCGRINMIEGSSISPEVIEQVKCFAKNHKTILVSLDSNHTHEHVLAELEAYAPLVSSGSYCVVFDTGLAYEKEETYPDRPWTKSRNPMTAVQEFLKHHGEFESDLMMDAKFIMTAAPKGFLKKQ